MTWYGVASKAPSISYMEGVLVLSSARAGALGVMTRRPAEKRIDYYGAAAAECRDRTSQVRRNIAPALNNKRALTISPADRARHVLRFPALAIHSQQYYPIPGVSS